MLHILSVLMYPPCLSYEAWKAHVRDYIVICRLSDTTIFFNITSLTEQFSHKKLIEHKVFALIFSTTSV